LAIGGDFSGDTKDEQVDGLGGLGDRTQGTADVSLNSPPAIAILP